MHIKLNVAYIVTDKKNMTHVIKCDKTFDDCGCFVYACCDYDIDMQSD